MNNFRSLIRLLSLPSDATNLYRVSFWILLTILAGLAAVIANSSIVIWGFAALACGGLLGFLFGIPRVEQGPLSSPGTVADPEEDPASPIAYRQTVNTNLTEISDWLTKIIVGVSLVQMTHIPPAFESLVEFLAGTKHDSGLVGGVLVFFGVAGFISGYLLTRLFLASAFSEADRAANEFNRKSTILPTQPGLLPTGETLDMIRNSPREAVLDNWELLLNAAKEAIYGREPNVQIPRLANSLRNKLVELELIGQQQAKVFDDLRRLRNIAAHSSQSISEEAAADYVNNAKALINALSVATTGGTIPDVG
jgi:hypothetical protein